MGAFKAGHHGSAIERHAVRHSRIDRRATGRSASASAAHSRQLIERLAGTGSAPTSGVLAGDKLTVPLQTTPAYDVVEHIGEVEVRRYRQALLAEVTLASPSQESLAMAVECFSQYIFGPDGAAGDTLRSQPPPHPHQRGRGDWRLRFFIASDLSLDDVPEPLSDSLRLLVAPPCLVAALAHEPRASGRIVHAARRKLQETIRATRRYELDDRSEWAPYGSPCLLPFGARSETLVELREASKTEAEAIWDLMTSSTRRSRVPTAA